MFSLELGPRFPRHRAGNRSSVSSKILPRKPVPNLERAGDRASDLLLTSLVGPHQLRQIRVGSPPIQEQLLHSHQLLPQPGRPKSKLQNPKSKTAVWILDFGVWSLDFGFWILDFGSWILDFGFWILDFGF